MTKKILELYLSNDIQSCYDLEDTLYWGMELFRRIDNLYNDEKLIIAASRIWLNASLKYLKIANEFITRGHKIKDLQKFEQYIYIAKRIIEPDDWIKPIEELTPSIPPPERMKRYD